MICNWKLFAKVVTLLVFFFLGLGFPYRTIIPVTKMAYAEGFSNSTLEKKHPNVLLIVVDTLGARHLSVYNKSTPLTLNFDRWAQEGLLFENARTNVTSTGPSISSILTGKSPMKSHVLNYYPVLGSSANENLLTYLESFGYATASVVDLEYGSVAFHGLPTPTDGETLTYLPPRINAINQWMANLARNLGFSLRFRLPEFLALTHKPFQEALNNLVDQLNERNRELHPFFFYVHLYLPSRISAKLGPPLTAGTYPRFYPPEEQPEINLARQDYDKTVAEWDKALGQFLDSIKTQGILDSTIVIITADHGESFNRGFWGHGDDLSEDSIQIPLLILAPSQKRRRILDPIQNCDIGPTLLDLLYLPKPIWMDGISALNKTPRQKAVTFNNLIRGSIRDHIAFPGLASGRSIAIYENNLKFIEHPKGAPDELYNLSQDPKESQNLASSLPKQAQSMKQKLAHILTSAQ